MANSRSNPPRPTDTVLGGAVPTPTGAIVLGGIRGAQSDLASPLPEQRLLALPKLLNYGAEGLVSLVSALADRSTKVQRSALQLLWYRPEPFVKSALENYSHYQLLDCAQVLTGHTQPITDLLLVNDQTLVSTCGGGDIYLWNLQTGSYQTLAGHKGMVTSLAFCPYTQTLFSGGHDRTIRAWDLATGTVQKILTGHGGYVNSVALTPDGSLLVSGSQDTTIKLWDVITGEIVHTLRGHTNLVAGIALSPDGKTIASCSYDTTIRIWDVVQGEQIWEFIGHSARVLSFAISPDGRFLASGSLDTRIMVWDLHRGHAVTTLEGHWGWVKDLVFSRDGKTLVSASYKMVKFWDMVHLREITSISAHGDLINAIDLSGDSQVLVTGGNDHLIQVWRVP